VKTSIKTFTLKIQVYLHPIHYSLTEKKQKKQIISNSNFSRHNLKQKININRLARTTAYASYHRHRLTLFLILNIIASCSTTIDIEFAKIDCLSLCMCPLLAQLKIGFFSSFSDAAVYSTNEANKAGLKQSIIFRCL
jgi:hypothetical protein